MADPKPTIPEADKDFLANFEPDVFWEQHGHKVLGVLLGVIVVALGLFLRQKHAAEQDLIAANRLASAEDAAALSQIILDYPNNEYAAQAMIRLGDLLYTHGDFEAAAAQYQSFLADYRENKLISSAQLGLAAVSEANQDYNGALSQYQQLGSGDQEQHILILAKMGAARCFQALGELTPARQTYEEALALSQGTQFQSSIFASIAVLDRELRQNRPSETAE